ncbi:Epithelial-stromal interaction protein 1 [Liparis tanakae]|uniref:Epithelial-stromal interaction protein 1 n=1 Tax=Liparis tanakae TaxID=230148 RepID=A0A4Z2H6A4_9TELE|nr:Epithelial-stromal interaction protein 1 [Liparis tanakae]
MRKETRLRHERNFDVENARHKRGEVKAGGGHEEVPRGTDTGEGARAAGELKERKARSSSTTAKTRTKPEYRGAAGSSVTPKGRERSAAPSRQGALQPRHERHEAFTAIAPNPKTRRDTQRKAEAGLAALEELRLSRAMAYVSINPSSVGGCLSLEEVRLKQQQEMLRAKRNQKPVRKQLVEQTAVLNITSKYQ